MRKKYFIRVLFTFTTLFTFYINDEMDNPIPSVVVAIVLIVIVIVVVAVFCFHGIVRQRTCWFAETAAMNRVG